MPSKVGSPSRISSSPMSRLVSRLWLRRIRPIGISARMSCSLMVSGMRSRGERDLAWTKIVPPAESLTIRSFTSLPSSTLQKGSYFFVGFNRVSGIRLLHLQAFWSLSPEGRSLSRRSRSRPGGRWESQSFSVFPENLCSKRYLRVRVVS